MAIEPGRVLCERYRLVRPVGQGSMASVWIAEHLALTTTVAVKLIDPELAKKQDALERFRREATAAAQLRSAHVVQILDHGVDDGQPFIVMELLEGEDLWDRLNKRDRLGLEETSRIVTQVARALSRAHAAGIVHRDLKPENVFLVPNEDDEIAKVLDFGVAKMTDPAKHTMQRTGIGTLIGTPHYMSPEQVKGISEVDFRTDLWALGVMAYQCVTGLLPFDSEGVGDLLIKITIGTIPVPSRIRPELPASFDAWFAKACDREPANRFQSAKEMAEALAAVVGIPKSRASEAQAVGIRPAPSGPAVASFKAREHVVTDPPPSKKPRLALVSDLPPPLDEPASAASRTSLPGTDVDVDFDDDEAAAPAPTPTEPTGPPDVTPTVPVAPTPATVPVRVRAAAPAAAPIAQLAPHVRVTEAPATPTVSGLSSYDETLPPELDGSRKKRVLAAVAVAFAAAVVGVAWTTVAPLLEAESALPIPTNTVVAAPAAPQPSELASASAAAADAGDLAVKAVAPGKPERPADPKPAAVKTERRKGTKGAPRGGDAPGAEDSPEPAAPAPEGTSEPGGEAPAGQPPAGEVPPAPPPAEAPAPEAPPPEAPAPEAPPPAPEAPPPEPPVHEPGSKGLDGI